MLAGAVWAWLFRWLTGDAMTDSVSDDEYLRRMQVGDVLLHPTARTLYVVFDTDEEGVTTAAISQRALLLRTKIPEPERDDLTIALRHHTSEDVKEWVAAPAAQTELAQRMMFSDSTVVIRPVRDEAAQAA